MSYYIINLTCFALSSDEAKEEAIGAAAEAAGGGAGGPQGGGRALLSSRPGPRPRRRQPPAQAETVHYPPARVSSTPPHRVGLRHGL